MRYTTGHPASAHQGPQPPVQRLWRSTTGGMRQPPSYTYHPFLPPSASAHAHPYDAYHAPYGAFPAVASSPLGYAPLASPCYPPTAAYSQATRTVPVLPQAPKTLLNAYPAPVHPHSDGSLPPGKRTRANVGELGRSYRSSGPPIDFLTTVLEDVSMGKHDCKGGPCSLAVGNVISALRCAGPSVDMDVTSKAVDNCSSGCGNAVRLSEGPCAASRMLKVGSPLDVVLRYAASMVATNCCQGNCRAVPCSGSFPQSQRGITPSENPAQDADRYARVTTRTPGSLGAKRTKTTEATQTQR